MEAIDSQSAESSSHISLSMGLRAPLAISRQCSACARYSADLFVMELTAQCNSRFPTSTRFRPASPEPFPGLADFQSCALAASPCRTNNKSRVHQLIIGVFQLRRQMFKGEHKSAHVRLGARHRS